MAVPTAPPVALGMWIGKPELQGIAMSGSNWSGAGELYTTASSWLASGQLTNAALTIESETGGQNMRKVMAAALVFARLKPAAGTLHTEADALRAKIAAAIAVLVAIPRNGSTPDTRPARFLGGWAIAADLINLPAYDAALHATFRTWLDASLNFVWETSSQVIRTSSGRSPSNKGAWSRFSRACCAVYLNGALGQSTELTKLAQIYRRWLGNTSVATPAGETAFVANDPNERTWEQVAGATGFLRGVNGLGATRDGWNFDGIQPHDQYRGSPAAYSSSNFPNDFSSVRYNEVAAYAHLGLLHVLHRCGYTDLLTYEQSAQRRVLQCIKRFADSYGATSSTNKGYVYFTGPYEAGRPFANYLFGLGYPEARQRNQETGSQLGYAWTYWTFQGRSLAATPTNRNASFAGTFPLPQLRATAVQTGPTYRTQFAATLPAPALAVTVTRTLPQFAVRFSASFPLLVLALGATHAPPVFPARFRADIPLPTLAASATFTVPNAVFPLPVLRATVEVGGPTVYSTAFAGTFPLPELAAEATVEMPARSVAAAFTVPLPELDVTATRTVPDFPASFAGTLPLPALDTDAVVLPPVFATSFAGTLPLPEITATGTFVVPDATFPLPILAVTLDVEPPVYLASFAATFPLPALAVSVDYGIDRAVAFAATFLLPVLDVDARYHFPAPPHRARQVALSGRKPGTLALAAGKVTATALSAERGEAVALTATDEDEI